MQIRKLRLADAVLIFLVDRRGDKHQIVCVKRHTNETGFFQRNIGEYQIKRAVLQHTQQGTGMVDDYLKRDIRVIANVISDRLSEVTVVHGIHGTDAQGFGKGVEHT